VRDDNSFQSVVGPEFFLEDIPESGMGELLFESMAMAYRRFEITDWPIPVLSQAIKKFLGLNVVRPLLDAVLERVGADSRIADLVLLILNLIASCINSNRQILNDGIEYLMAICRASSPGTFHHVISSKLTKEQLDLIAEHYPTEAAVILAEPPPNV
jgi:hypothetical protein